MSDAEALRVLARAARLLVAGEREAGIVDLPIPNAPRPPEAETRTGGTPSSAGSAARDAGPARSDRTSPAPLERATTTAASAAPAAPSGFVPRVRPLVLPANALAAFGDLPARVAACVACRLCEGRTQTVFGEGTAPARLVFCGEGPGFEEDRSGRPFVGRAGELLTDMIEKGMKLRREDVFILNAVKCRPPDNRTPAPDEIEACRPFLLEQLAALRPDVIVALGNPACRALLGQEGIMKLRGRVFPSPLPGVAARIVPTYHPAYLLRNPEGKRDAWTDLKLVMSLLSGD
ncbi:MAG: hypothetical protein HMLKMBBP_00673 [Planctomycetes bacterium]|nr:hypothetical protein [Planctomycetota bacterium]